MALNRPPGIPAAGKLSVIFIPASGVANPAAIKVSEATASGAINASCHLLGDGWGRSTEQESTDRRRACDEYTYSVYGAKKVNFERAKFVSDPQNPASETAKVYAGLVEGELYWAVERIGISGRTEPAASQYYNAYLVRCDDKDQTVPGDEGELEFTAQFSSQGTPVKDKQFSA